MRTDLSRLGSTQIDALLNEVFDALFVTDPHGNIVYMNASANDLYGFGQLAEANRQSVNILEYSREEFDIHTLAGDELPEEEQPLSRALRGESYKGVELRVSHRGEGNERIFAFTGTRLEGDPPLGVLTIRDVTEARLAEERYRISFETNPAPTLIVRLQDGTLIDVNQGFIELTRVAWADTKGKSIVDIGFTTESESLLAQLSAGEQVRYEPARLDRQGAAPRQVLFSARPIRVEGTACGIVTFVDNTELSDARKLVEERTSALEEANAELDAFNYSVSHDLRAPLRTLNGFSQAILEDYGEELDERGLDYLRRIRAGAERMGELVDALLDLSRLTREELEVKTVDLSELAIEVAGDLQRSAAERQAEFRIAPGLVVEGDERMLQVVMQNLLSNAWKFSRHENVARIEVGCRRNGDELAYFVRDNGVGFDPRYSGRLFTAFQRLHSDDAFEGLGIGLATVHRIIRHHGGHVWAEGAEGEGATFYFTIPTNGTMNPAA